MRFAFIDAEKQTYPVAVLCRTMQVSRGGFYRWQKLAPCDRQVADEVMLAKIRRFHEASHGRYGSPRIHADLCCDGVAVSRKRVARLMRSDGLTGKYRRKFRGTTDSDHGLKTVPNLLKQQFHAPRPNRVWASDITQLRTLEGWLYLAIILDLFSRRVVGWAMRADMTTALVIEALHMALVQRQVERGLIFHSDKGSQYAADATQACLERQGLQPSMSGVGCCYDNAVSESFFSGLKIEVGDMFGSRRQARSDIFDFIEGFFNPYRRHGFNGFVSPRDCEDFFSRNHRRPNGFRDLILEAQTRSTTNLLGLHRPAVVHPASQSKELSILSI